MAAPKLVVRVAATLEELKKNLAEGINQIETTKKALQGMASSYDGSKSIAQANAVAAAIQQIGGVSKLTSTEQERANVIVSAAIEKYAALGKEAPPHLLALAEATKVSATTWESFVERFDPKAAIADPIGTAMAGMEAFAGSLGPVAVAGGIAIAAIVAIGSAIYGLATSAASYGANLDDMSDKTQMSVVMLSRLAAAAPVAGTTLEQLTGVVFKLEENMGKGGDAFDAGLKKMGLSTQTLKDAGPDQYLGLIIAGLNGIPDPSERAAAGTAVLGKGYRDIAASLGDLQTAMDLTKSVTPWTAEQAKTAEEFEQQVTAIKVKLENIGLSIGEAVLPMFVELFKEINKDIDIAKNLALAIGPFAQLIDDLKTLNAILALVNGTTGKVPDAAGPATVALNKQKQAIADLALQFPSLTDAEHAWRIEGEQLEASVKKQIAAAEKYGTALAELDSAGDGWRGTLDTLDGKVVEGIKYYLAAKVSQGALAEAYGVTATQVAAVNRLLNEEEAAHKRLQGVVQSTARYTIDAANSEAEAERLKYQYMLENSAQFTKSTIDHQRDVARAAQEHAAQWRQHWDAAFDAVEKKGKKSLDAIDKRAEDAAAKQKKLLETLYSYTYDLSTKEGIAEYRKLNPAASIVWTDDSIMAFIKAGGTLQDLLRQNVINPYAGYGNGTFTGPTTMPRFADGVTNFSGGMAIVGERGPEVVNLPRGASVYPTGSSGGVTITNHITINGSVLSDERKIADAVGDALMNRLRSQGVRFPSGA